MENMVVWAIALGVVFVGAGVSGAVVSVAAARRTRKEKARLARRKGQREFIASMAILGYK